MREAWKKSNPKLQRSIAHIAKLNTAESHAKMAATALERGQRHWSAREFTLIDPDGNHHAGRNVQLFVREHAELFLPDDLAERPGKTCRAARGLRDVLRGKNDSWKGWTRK